MKELTQKIAYLDIDQYDLSGSKRPQLDASDYAVILVADDEVYPKFPIDTYEHVKQSARALEQTKNNVPEEIVKVARFFINNRLFFFSEEKLAEYDKEDIIPTDGNIVVLSDIDENEYMEKLSSGVSETDKYALEIDKNKKYIPINDEEQIKEACRFMKNLKGAPSWAIPGEYRIKIARSLVKEAELYFMDVPKAVRRFAMPDTTVEDIKRAARARIKVAGEHVLQRILPEKDNIYLKKIANGEEPNLVKVCDFFNRIDEKTGYADLKRRTGQGDAYDELFVIKNASQTKKTASNRKKYLTITEARYLGEA